MLFSLRRKPCRWVFVHFRCLNARKLRRERSKGEKRTKPQRNYAGHVLFGRCVDFSFGHVFVNLQEVTVKGLEPDIQKLIAKHKAEVKKLKSSHQVLLHKHVMCVINT